MSHTAALINERQAHSVLSYLWSATIKPALRAGQRLEVVVREARKSREQEKKYHAQIADIAAQWRYLDVKWDEEDMKRILVNAFKEDTKNDPDLRECWREMGELKAVPGMRGGLVILGDQTRKFPKKLASAFVEWLYALGAEVGVTWSEPQDQRAGCPRSSG